MRSVLIYLLIAWMLFLCLPLCAQELSALPKITPSYSEDFIDYKSNPSMCFNNALFDGSGRMWLTPCTGTLTGLHLFQFDGYDFNAIRGSLDKLPTDTKFIFMDEKQRLVGYVNEPGNQQVVFYALQTGELTAYPLPRTEVGSINKIFWGKNGRLRLHYVVEDHLLEYELQGEQFVLTHKIVLKLRHTRYLINIVC